MNDLVVNGRIYPMWQQFVQKQNEWIGGVLTDFDEDGAATEITGIALVANGETSAFFEIIGKRFSCGADVKYLAIGGHGGGAGITFRGFGGHTFSIEKPTGRKTIGV